MRSAAPWSVLACYLGLIPFDPATLRFDGIVRRHLEIMTGAGIVAGLIYWMIAGRNAGAWREPPRPLRPRRRLCRRCRGGAGFRSVLGAGPIDPGALNIVLGFGFIFISGFALLPAMIVVAITEAFYIRGVLTYAIGGGLVGLACYLGLVPFDPDNAALRRHRPASSRNHDRRGDRRRRGLLDDRGPQCRRLARAAAAAAVAAAAAGHSPAPPQSPPS